MFNKKNVVKTILIIFLTICIMLSFCACGVQEPETTTETEPETTTEPAPPAAEVLTENTFADPLTGWSAYDSLLEKIRTEGDGEERVRLIKEAEQMLMSSYCVLPMYYNADTYLAKPVVTGVYSDSYGTKYFKRADVTDNTDAIGIYMGGNPVSLDPALVETAYDITLAVNLFSGLYSYDENGNYVPECAVSYEVSEDGLTYVFVLRDDVVWSNGTPVTAADFEYSWKRAARLSSGGSYRWLYSIFEGYSEDKDSDINVTAVGDYMLRVVLSKPCTYIEELLSFPVFYPVYKADVERTAEDEDPLAWSRSDDLQTNGPFFCSRWTENYLTLKASGYYFDSENVLIGSVEFLLSEDEDDAYKSYYKKDMIDIMNTVTDKAATEYPDHVASEERAGTYVLVFNAESDLFEGKTANEAVCLRKAISLLIDRNYITTYFGNAGERAANTYLTAGMQDGNGGIYGADEAEGYYDLNAVSENREAVIAEAKELIEAAGYAYDSRGMLPTSNNITITLTIESGKMSKAAAMAVQQDLEQVGIKLEIEELDSDAYEAALQSGEFMLAGTMVIPEFDDPYYMLNVWASGSERNIAGLGGTGEED